MRSRRSMLRGILFCVILGFLVRAIPAVAGTIQVNPGQSIQAAIDGAAEGDKIEVGPGTYNEPIDFKGKAIRLYSSGGPEATVINGAGAYHVVKCVSGETANTVLEGFTITGGNANGAADYDIFGGGMFNNNSSPTVTQCIFKGNLAAEAGGGMLNNNSSPTVAHCIFEGNEVTEGGNGGGMCNWLGNPIITHCIFRDNTAWRGGGMSNSNNSPAVTDCIFSGNSAGLGGGMYNNISSPTVINCTFTQNSANQNGGGMYFATCSNPIVTNGILWGDTPNEISFNLSSPIVTYCDVQGGWAGTGNINRDPMFFNAGGDDWGLSACSPCVDTGNNAAVPAGITTDLVGGLRFFDDTGVIDRGAGTAPIVDMGAYERQVNSSTWPIRNTTQSTGYCCIQPAIERAADGDAIEVGPGTYNEAIDFKGKAIRLYSSGGPEVTIINGTGSYHVVQCVSGETADTILEGFTITGGNANGSPYPDENGGGMLNVNSSPTVTRCIFRDNLAAVAGAMCNNNSRPTVTNCAFINNRAGKHGGAVENYLGSHASFVNCIFSRNSASLSGGAIINNQSSPNLINCTFAGNSVTTSSGGGIRNWDNSHAVVTNCILWGDTPNEFSNDHSTPKVTFSDVQGGWTGTGNINADPRFIDAAVDNLRLLVASSCIDKGNNNSLPQDIADLDQDGDTAEAIPLDLAGHSRMTDGDADGSSIVDMGAFELECRVYNVTKDAYFATIQLAIDHADNGNQIEVLAGTYPEAINFNNKSITLRSTNPNDPAIVAATIIDASGLGSSTVICSGYQGSDTVLAGFTITGGSARNGGGMYCENSSPTVTHCTFKGNSAENGGGMYNTLSSPSVSNCLFQGNATYDGLDYGIHRDSPHGNHGGHAGHGGGMYNVSSSPVIRDCQFTENRTGNGGKGQKGKNGGFLTSGGWGGNGGNAGYGAGIYSQNGGPKILRCRFSGNQAGDGGDGGAGGGEGWGMNYTYSGGTGGIGGGGGNGAGLYNNGSTPVVADCEFINNSTGQGGHGGDAHNAGGDGGNGGWGGYGAGIHSYLGSLDLTNCVFGGNRTSSGGGGGDTDLTLFSDGGTGGDGGSGGGVCNDGNTGKVTNCTFYRNGIGEGGKGGTGSFLNGGKPGYGGGICNVNTSNLNFFVTNCILRENSREFDFYTHQRAKVTHCNIQHPFGSVLPGSIDTDPQFVDIDNPDLNLWNLRLRPGSPCIDAGSNAAPILPDADYDGHPRMIDGDCFGGPQVDMGAYEFNYADKGDFNYNCRVDLPDLLVLAESWMTQPGDAAWNRIGDISDPHDMKIDLSDLAVVAENWLGWLGTL